MEEQQKIESVIRFASRIDELQPDSSQEASRTLPLHALEQGHRIAHSLSNQTTILEPNPSSLPSDLPAPLWQRAPHDNPHMLPEAVSVMLTVSMLSLVRSLLVAADTIEDGTDCYGKLCNWNKIGRVGQISHLSRLLQTFPLRSLTSRG